MSAKIIILPIIAAKHSGVDISNQVDRGRQAGHIPTVIVLPVVRFEKMPNALGRQPRRRKKR